MKYEKNVRNSGKEWKEKMAKDEEIEQR